MKGKNWERNLVPGSWLTSRLTDHMVSFRLVRPRNITPLAWDPVSTW